jgi:hypothetical protein
MYYHLHISLEVITAPALEQNNALTNEFQYGMSILKKIPANFK